MTVNAKDLPNNNLNINEIEQNTPPNSLELGSGKVLTKGLTPCELGYAGDPFFYYILKCGWPVGCPHLFDE